MTQPSTPLTFEEAVDSLTGFDELAIEKAFSLDITTLLTDRAMRALRAVVFVLNRRDGMKDTEAYTAAMDLSLGQVNAYFTEEPDEIMPDHPETELGKGDSGPVEQPTSSQPSAS